MPNPDYRKMFEDLDPYYPQPKDLNELATFMSKQARFPDAARILESLNVLVQDQPEPIPIPAGYTYLAQFIIHDISFDERSDRHIREDLPWNVIDTERIRELRNLRKPNFDLETVYGYEEPTNRGEPRRSELMRENSPLPFLKLGNTEKELGTGTPALSYPCDLPRKDGSVEANIVDPRNDENLLLAQTLVAFIKFHNAIVVKLIESGEYKDEAGNYKKEELFEKARKLTIRYYQTIVLTDFLPRVVQRSVVEEVMLPKNTKKLFYQPDLFIPLEFSVAAFRFGHSMIRQKYNLNVSHFDKSPPLEMDTSANLFHIMMFTGKGRMGANEALLNLPSIWIINWNLFYEIDGSPVNYAEPINIDLALGLLRLRPKTDSSINRDGRASALAALDLYRGRRFGLPTGQDVAKKIGEKPLDAARIVDLIMSKEIKGVSANEAEEIKERLCAAFAEKTPLWFYILAEAELQKDGKLGSVGSRIVAETIIQLLYHSEYSILRQDWEDGEDFLLKNSDEFFANPEIKTFGMPEMLKFIQEMNEKYSEKLYPTMQHKFDEINPLGKG